MSRAEIKSKFDDIVAFAEIEKFLDTPVKRYSSGMYVRLAFAVAAHLDPEIHVKDEVLAVGDAEFQRKCLGKMSEGRPQRAGLVLFVSHNMGAVATLCNRCLWLDGGRVLLEDDPKTAIAAYLKHNAEDRSEKSWSQEDAPGDDSFRLRSVRICQPAEKTTRSIDITKPFEIEIESSISAGGQKCCSCRSNRQLRR